MANKDFTVVMEINAPSKDAVDRMIDGMPHADRIYDCEITDPDIPRFECRIRYEENWHDKGEHFVFENRWTDEDVWGLDTAFKLTDDRISYQALTKIRELMKNGIHFYFSK